MSMQDEEIVAEFEEVAAAHGDENATVQEADADEDEDEEVDADDDADEDEED